MTLNDHLQWFVQNHVPTPKYIHREVLVTVGSRVKQFPGVRATTTVVGLMY